MFHEEIVQRFILQTHPVQLVMLEKRYITLDDFFSYEKYVEVLENPTTIELLCEKWEIPLPSPRFENFITRWNLLHLLDQDTPLWYCAKYSLQFLLHHYDFNKINEIYTKRQDLYEYLSEKEIINVNIQLYTRKVNVEDSNKNLRSIDYDDFLIV